MPSCWFQRFQSFAVHFFCTMALSLLQKWPERLALLWSLRFVNKSKRGLGSPFFRNGGNRSKLRRQSLIPTKFTIWCAWPCVPISCRRVLILHLQFAIWEHTPFAEGKWGLCSPPSNLGGTLSRLRHYSKVPIKASWMCKTASGERRDFLKSVSLITVNFRKQSKAAFFKNA